MRREKSLNISGLEKQSLDDIKHFGVKGMRWGHRKGGDNTRSYGKLKSKGVFDRKGNKAIRKAIGKDFKNIAGLIGKDVGREMKRDFKSISAASRKLATPIVKTAIAAAAGVTIGATIAGIAQITVQKVYG